MNTPPFSITKVSVGLGLATASHLYLCHRNLLQADQERQYHKDLSEQCEVDLLFQSLTGRALFSELVDLLDSTLLLHSDCAGDSNYNCSISTTTTCTSTSSIGRRRRRRRRRTTTTTTSGRQYHQSGLRHRCFHQQEQEQQRQQTGPRMPSSSPTSGARDAKPIIIDMHQQQQQQPLSTPLDLCSTETTSRNAVTLSQHQPPSSIPAPAPASPTHQSLALRDHVELWIQACRQLRLTQEREARKTTDRICARQPSFWALKANIAVSLVLGAGMLTGLFKDRQHTSSSSFAYHILSTLFSPFVSSSSSSGLGGGGPIGCCLFLGGVHLLTAFRTHWALSELSGQLQCQGQGQGRRQSHSHLVFLERTNVVARCLDIRERRLLYLMQLIKAHEENGQQQLEQRRSRIAGPTLLALPSMNFCTALSSSRQDPMDETTVDSTIGQEQASAAAAAEVVIVDDEVLGQEPSLVCMNKTRFLRDPAEQSRVLRMELQALKQDLKSLHNMVL